MLRGAGGGARQERRPDVRARGADPGRRHVRPRRLRAVLPRPRARGRRRQLRGAPHLGLRGGARRRLRPANGHGESAQVLARGRGRGRRRRRDGGGARRRGSLLRRRGAAPGLPRHEGAAQARVPVRAHEPGVARSVDFFTPGGLEDDARPRGRERQAPRGLRGALRERRTAVGGRPQGRETRREEERQKAGQIGGTRRRDALSPRRVARGGDGAPAGRGLWRLSPPLRGFRVRRARRRDRGRRFCERGGEAGERRRARGDARRGVPQGVSQGRTMLRQLDARRLRLEGVRQG